MTTATDINASGIAFMRTEVSMGLAFAKIATDAVDETQKRDRNRLNAQKAYDALMKFLPRLTLTPVEWKELCSGAERLRLAIAAIPL